MADSWDDYAEEWDRNEQVRDYANRAFSCLTEKLDLRVEDLNLKRVLDFGCGTGLLTEKLSPLVREVVAVDSSQKMTAVLRKKAIGNVTAICADLDDEAVRAECFWFSGFDLIVASSVCGFVPDYGSTLKLLAGALVDGGMFVQWDWMASDREEFGLSEERVESALRSAGFTEIQIGTPFKLSMQGAERPVLMAYAVAGAL